MAAAAAARRPPSPRPCPEEPEVFEIDLPITIFELSDDEFLEREDEEQTALNEDGCLKSQTKEVRRMGNEQEEQMRGDGFKGNNREEPAMPIEVAKMKEDDEEVPLTCENLNLVQVVLFQNAVDNADHDQSLVMGFLDCRTQNGTGNECVKINQFENDHNYHQRMVAPCLNTQNKGGGHVADGVIQMFLSVAEEMEPVANESVRESLTEPACMHIGANDEGAAPLEIGFNRTDNGLRKSGGLEDYILLGHKLEEQQAENEKCLLPFSNGDRSLREAGSLTVNDCANPEPDVVGHDVQPLEAGCSEEYDMQESLNGSSESTEDGQQLQVEQLKEALLLNNKPESNTLLLSVMEMHTKTRGAWKCLFCNLRHTSSICLKEHIYATHKDKKIHKCNFCHRKFFFYIDLKRHHMFHMKIKSLKKREKNRNNTGEDRRSKNKIAMKKKTTKKKKESKYEKFFSEMRRELKPSKSFCCTICPFASPNPKHFTHHMKEHNDRPPYQCPRCEYSSDNHSYVLKHLYWHAGYKLYKCTFCTFLSQYFSSMVKHSFLHTGAKPYWCAVCEGRFTSASSLNKHAVMHSQRQKGNNLPIARKERLSSRKKYTCTQCSIAFYTRKHLQRHQKYHTQVQDSDKTFRNDCVKECEQSKQNSCSQKTQALCSDNEKPINPSQSNKQLMPREKYQEDGSQEETHAQKKCCPSNLGCEMLDVVPNTYVCDHCNLVFRREELLIYHRGTHFQAQPSENVTCKYQEAERNGRLHVGQPSCGPALKLFKCHQCAYTTSSFSNLRVHFSVHTGEKPFKCLECDKSFRNSSHLKRHRFSHLWKHYKCRQCLFIGTTLEDLKRHEETCKDEGPARKICRSSSSSCENSEKQINMSKGRGNKSTLVLPESHVQVYKCEHCDYATYILGRLKCHTRIHTGERPYSCDVCQKNFSTSSHLKRHKFVHQNLELLKCDSCGLAMGNWQSFKQHLASHRDKQPPLGGHSQKQPPSRPVKIYKCEECDYTTIRNGNLKIHLRIHTGEKPHKCPHCSLAFRTSSHLSRHLGTHLKCKKCKFSATNKCVLQKHAQTHKKKRRKTQKKKTRKVRQLTNAPSVEVLNTTPFTGAQEQTL